MARRPARDGTTSDTPPEDATADRDSPNTPSVPGAEGALSGEAEDATPTPWAAAAAASDTPAAAPDPVPAMAPADDPAPPIGDAAPVMPSRSDPPLRRGAGGFFGLVLGGALAAALGAGAVVYLQQQGLTNLVTAQPDMALVETVQTQGATLSSLRAAVEKLSADAAKAAARPLPDPAALDALGLRLDALAAAQADIATSLAKADERLTTLETRPEPSGPTVPSVAESSLAEVQKLLDTQRAEAEAAQASLAAAAAEAEARIKAAEDEAQRLKAESEAEAQRARARAAISHLQAALESGAPIQPALDDLTALGVAVPATLTDQAGGVPTLDALKAAFPPAARDALTLSLRETVGTGVLDRTLAFLRVQSGARSLTPRAGDDADAVLSRAESALGTGDLAAAITEITALPPSGQARMAEWVSLAQRRLDAVQAAKSLTAAD